MPEWFSNLEIQWEEPAFARTLERLGAFASVLMVDRRGLGLAGPVDLEDLPTLDEWCDDLVAVVQEIRAVPLSIVAAGGAGPLGITLATRPELEIGRLALMGTSPRFRGGPDYPIGLPDEALDSAAELTQEMWGSGRMLSVVAPDRSRDTTMRRWFARFERMSASPGAAAAMQRFLVDVDVRALLADIEVPTVVFHRTYDQAVPLSHGRYLADHIPDASLVELPGSAHVCFGDAPQDWIDELQRFLTGSHAQGPDRRIMAVLFTDIVGSTERAAAIGDERWREILEKHDVITAAEVKAHEGIIVNFSGDGMLARFDGPADAIHTARRIQAAVAPLDLAVRAGVHVGEVEVRGDELSGLAVHIGARVAATAVGHQVVVSRTVRDLLIGSRYRFEEQPAQRLKGVPDIWELYSVAD